MDESQIDRVKKELIAAGVTRYGLVKAESKELPRILHDDEHIGGVVYGQIGGGSSAMLVATDKRVIFLDKRPLFMTTDEVTYDVVSGVKNTKAGPFTSITLHTRISDYTLRYVNAKCAHIFVEYIEGKRLEKGRYNPETSRDSEETPVLIPQNFNDNKALNFLKEHDLGVLSTVDRTGNVHGAVIYYIVDPSNFIYILTKSGTGKGRNVYAHSQVALTVHEVGTMQTLQVQGMASVETNQEIKRDVFNQVVKPRPYRGKNQLPPVTKLKEGSFMVIRINPTVLSFHDYAKE
jgi:general stress protein 26